MDSDVRISVIVPVFNSEKTIERCVNSVVNQSYKNWELLLIDDGSTDHSLELCNHLAEKDARIKVFHKDNGGVSSARNYGMNKAEGEYLAFIDSDDSVEDHYLQVLMDTKENNRDVQHIWTCFQTIDGMDLEPVPVLASVHEKYTHFTRKDVVTLYNLWVLQGPYCKLYETEIIKKNNIRMNENVSLGEDLMFNLDYLDVCTNPDIVVVNIPVYNYFRDNENSLDHVYRPNLSKTAVDLKIYMRRFLDKWNVNEHQMQLFYDAYFHTYENILSNTMSAKNTMSDKEKVSFNNRILQSDAFKQILNQRTCYVNPLLLKAYRSGNYRNVILFYKIAGLKNSLLK